MTTVSNRPSSLSRSEASNETAACRKSTSVSISSSSKFSLAIRSAVSSMSMPRTKLVCPCLSLSARKRASRRTLRPSVSPLRSAYRIRSRDRGLLCPPHHRTSIGLSIASARRALPTLRTARAGPLASLRARAERECIKDSSASLPKPFKPCRAPCSSLRRMILRRALQCADEHSTKQRRASVTAYVDFCFRLCRSDGLPRPLFPSIATRAPRLKQRSKRDSTATRRSITPLA